MSNIPEVTILGAGVVGQTLAVALALAHRRVALVQAPTTFTAAGDVRAYALNQASQALLAQLNAWPSENATPVHRMKVWGDKGGAIEFASSSTHAPLSWIVDVPELERKLREQIQNIPGIEQRKESTHKSPLTIVCEGRHSATRQELGVQRQRLPYGQVALATRMRTQLSHGGQATQWFKQKGMTGPSILALLPMGGPQGQEVAVVWSLLPGMAQQLLAAKDSLFEQWITDASENCWGNLTLTAPRACWPLEWGQADHWSGRHGQNQAWVLAGDAARNVHPLAGLGLNLGLGDARALLAHLPMLGAAHHWRPLHDLRALRAYERQRKAECLPTTCVIDGLQRLFMHPHALAQTLRNGGLNMLNHIPSLKEAIIARALAPL